MESRAVVQVRKQGDGYVLPVLVSAGARRDEVRGPHDGRLKLAVTAAPEKGKANKAVCKLLADRLGVKTSQVRILSGHASRRKEVLVERIPPGTLDGIIA